MRGLECVTLVGPFPRPYGGISVHTFRLGERLTGMGVRVRAFANSRHRPSVDVDMYLGNRPLKHFWCVYDRGIGVVHVHHAVSPLTLMSVLGARSRGLPSVVTLHGRPVSFPMRRRRVDVLLRLALRLCSAVVYVSEGVRAEVLDSIGRSRAIFGPIPAFIPPTERELTWSSSAFERWRSTTAGEGPIIAVTISRVFGPESGRSGDRDIYGIRAVWETCEHLIEREARFRLALLLGQGPRDSGEAAYLNRYGSSLRRLLGNRMVSLVGEHGASVIAKSGVYYRPTTVDGDSVALREALVMGVPVVASDATQRPSGVEVVGVGDWAAAAEAIMGALDDADEDGKEEGTVGDNECVERLVNIYSRILK